MRSFCVVPFVRAAGLGTPSHALCMVAALAALAFSGCAANLPQAASGLAAPGEAAGTWACHGRFSIRYEDQSITHSTRNAYGNFDWSEARNGDVTLQLRTPLGQTLAVITSSAYDATLTLPGHAPLAASDVTSLMRGAVGFSLPVEGLRYWLRGEGKAGAAAAVKVASGNAHHITQIIQDGWIIDYVPYADTSAASGGVTHINLSRTDPPIEIRIVLDQ
jgi:outer membrane lipoprotein LolB